MLFVDIDGVLSVFGFSPADPPAGAWTQVDGIAHLLSAAAAEHLRGLGTRFERVWCSGWEDRANDHLPHLLGLGPFPYLRFARSDREHWKLEAIDAYAGDRPLAWIDDDVNAACHAWASQRGAPTLVVVTDPAVGLDSRATGELEAFAEGLGSPR